MNNDYFKTWSPEMAYYLGWLWADGSISPNNIQVGCITDDEDVLLGFLRAIDSHHAVIRLSGYQHKKGYYVNAYTKCTVHGKTFSSYLIEKHGIPPRKTYLNPSFPDVAPEYLPHFIRGYFDGDGCICKSDCVSVSMVGTQKFIQGMGEAIYQQIGIKINPILKNKQTQSPNAAWNIRWDKKVSVLTFLNFIYCGEPYLKRKKQLVDQWRDELVSYCQTCGIDCNDNRIRLRFLGKNLGTYKTIEECQFARNYAHLQKEGYVYPISSPDISIDRQHDIKQLVDARLEGNKIHQRTLLKGNYNVI